MNRIIRDGNIIDRMMDEMGYKRGTMEGEECLDDIMNRACFVYRCWYEICERYGISSVDWGYTHFYWGTLYQHACARYGFNFWFESIRLSTPYLAWQ